MFLGFFFGEKLLDFCSQALIHAMVQVNVIHSCNDFVNCTVQSPFTTENPCSFIFEGIYTAEIFAGASLVIELFIRWNMEMPTESILSCHEIIKIPTLQVSLNLYIPPASRRCIIQHPILTRIDSYPMHAEYIPFGGFPIFPSEAK